jgi:hypothetical protein
MLIKFSNALTFPILNHSHLPKLLIVLISVDVAQVPELRERVGRGRLLPVALAAASRPDRNRADRCRVPML